MLARADPVSKLPTFVIAVSRPAGCRCKWQDCLSACCAQRPLTVSRLAPHFRSAKWDCSDVLIGVVHSVVAMLVWLANAAAAVGCNVGPSH